jgi:hypothetical protein
MRACVRAQPDVIALQDVLTGEAGQDAAIVEALELMPQQEGPGAYVASYRLFACRTALSHLARLCVTHARARIRLLLCMHVMTDVWPMTDVCVCVRVCVQRRQGGCGVRGHGGAAAALQARACRAALYMLLG